MMTLIVMVAFYAEPTTEQVARAVTKGTTETEVARAVRAEGTVATTREVRRAIERAVKEGKVRKETGLRWGVWFTRYSK